MKGASIAIDWGSLEDSFSEVVGVPSNASAASATTPTCAVKPELAAMSDEKLKDNIKLGYFLKNTEIKSDGGEKLRYNIDQIKEEHRRRETSRSSKLQASREPLSRSISHRGHSRMKDRDQRPSRDVPSRSLSDRIRSRVCSDGFADLSKNIFSKKRKEPKPESPLDYSDSDKVTREFLRSGNISSNDLTLLRRKD